MRLGSPVGVAGRRSARSALFERACRSLSLAAFRVWRNLILAKLAIFSSLVQNKQEIEFPDTAVFFFRSDRNILITKVHESRCRRLAHQTRGLEKGCYIWEARTASNKNTTVIFFHQKPRKEIQNIVFSSCLCLIMQFLPSEYLCCVRIKSHWCPGYYSRIFALPKSQNN